MLFVNGFPVDCSCRFPDGTYSMKLSKDIRNSLSDERSTVLRWNYSGEHEMSALFFIVHHLRDNGISDIVLQLPYVPNARLDRVKSEGEVFTLKYFAKLINSLEFREVHVFDPHSNVSTALIDRVRVDNATRYILQAGIQTCDMGNLVLFFPDEGAVKRYSESIGKPFIYAEKRRDWVTHAITGLKLVHHDVDTLQDRPVLMVDDICCRGDTFFNAANALKAAGAGDIYAYCSHLETTVFIGSLLECDGLIKKMFTTDSIFPYDPKVNNHDKITVFHLW